MAARKNIPLPLKKTQSHRNKNFFDLRKVVSETAIHFALITQKKNLFLAMDITPCTPRHVYGDPVRFAEILSCLINNSLQSVSQGGITVTIDSFGPTSNGKCHVVIDITATTSCISDSNHASSLTQADKMCRSQEGSLQTHYSFGWGTRYVASLTYEEFSPDTPCGQIFHIPRGEQIPCK